MLKLSLSLSLGYYDTSYDYEDFFYHYNLNKESDSFPDFEDMANQKPHISKTVDDNYPWLTANHARRGDIMVELRSPHGTVSTLLPYRKFDYINAKGYSYWPFMSVHHWGENPVGSWTITVTYKNYHAKVIVTVHGFDIYGTSQDPEAVSRIPETCDPACARGCAAAGPKYCDACKDFRNQFNLECVSECAFKKAEYNNYCLNVSHTSLPSTMTRASSHGELAPTINNLDTSVKASSHEELAPTINNLDTLSKASSHKKLATTINNLNTSTKASFHGEPVPTTLSNQDNHSKQNHLSVLIPSVMGGVIVITMLIIACAVVVVFIARRAKQKRGGISYYHMVQVEDFEG